jgi:hypothetical protein
VSAAAVKLNLKQKYTSSSPPPPRKSFEAGGSSCSATEGITSEDEQETSSETRIYSPVNAPSAAFALPREPFPVQENATTTKSVFNELKEEF